MRRYKTKKNKIEMKQDKEGEDIDIHMNAYDMQRVRKKERENSEKE